METPKIEMDLSMAQRPSHHSSQEPTFDPSGLQPRSVLTWYPVRRSLLPATRAFALVPWQPAVPMKKASAQGQFVAFAYWLSKQLGVDFPFRQTPPVGRFLAGDRPNAALIPQCQLGSPKMTS
jgi:hypothetical protein